jgi:ketosteroid isomerase-like protein
MKKISFYILCSAFVMACSSKEADNKNVETTRAMFDAFNRHDWEAMTTYYNESASFLDPSFGTSYVTKTRQETASKYAEMQKMFPDLHDELVGVYPSGDKVTVEFVSTGTMSDSIKFSLPIVTVLTFENGLIVKDATYYDLENP